MSDHLQLVELVELRCFWAFGEGLIGCGIDAIMGLISVLDDGNGYFLLNSDDYAGTIALSRHQPKASAAESPW